jgi:hypothetical protein
MNFEFGLYFVLSLKIMELNGMKCIWHGEYDKTRDFVIFTALLVLRKCSHCGLGRIGM